MQDLIVLCIITLLLSIVLKFIFWISISKKNFKLLYKSFLRFYSVYDMHDAPSSNHLIFWKASNVINLFCWAAFFGLVVIGIFSLTTF